MLIDEFKERKGMTRGWEPILSTDHEMITAAWMDRLQVGRRVVVPKPWRRWQGTALAQVQQHPDVQAEFTGSLLSALRACTEPSSQLWVIDWQHDWYFLDPHTATSDGIYPMLPDGDSYNYVDPQFRFGLVMGWQRTGPVTLFGEKLLAALDLAPPLRFLEVCGEGETAEVTS